MTMSRASANHLSLHALLGMPQDQHTNIGGGKSGMLDQSKLPKQSAAERRMPAAESRPVDAKKKRQARQASIIIEELERALGDLSTGGSRNRREDGEVLVDDASDISFYEETDMQ